VHYDENGRKRAPKSKGFRGLKKVNFYHWHKKCFFDEKRRKTVKESRENANDWQNRKILRKNFCIFLCMQNVLHLFAQGNSLRRAEPKSCTPQSGDKKE